MAIKVSDEIKKQILTLNGEGKNSLQIGVIVHLDRRTIQKYLKSQGLNFLSNSRQIRKCHNDECDKTFEVIRSSKNKYCSRKCATFVINSSRSKKTVEELECERRNRELKKEKYKGLSPSGKLKKYWDEKLLEEDFCNLSFDRKRRRIILEQSGQCNKCQLTEWFGKPLSLEIDHKDGNRNNNERNNLEGICPNCHSITDTWRGRNKRGERKKEITPEEMVQSYLDNNGNIRQALIQLELSPKGGNYPRMYKFLELAGIEYKKAS